MKAAGTHMLDRAPAPMAGQRSTIVPLRESRDAWMRFAPDASGRTRLHRQHSQYPFHVGRALYLDAEWPELATVILQCASGGVFGGDCLRTQVETAAGSHAQVVTQGSTKVHSMPRGRGRLEAQLELSPDSYLEYLSDPLILFPDSRISTSLRVVLDEDAQAVIHDSMTWHDPAGTAPAFAFYESEFIVEDRSAHLLVFDRCRIDAPAARRDLSAALQEFRVQGTVYVIAKRDLGELRGGIAQYLGARRDAYAGVTLLPNGAGLCARVLASEGYVLRGVLREVVALARMALVGKAVGSTWRK